MKSELVQPGWQDQGRTPQGVRGLKYKGQEVAVDGRLSHPARGAWIEI